MSFKFERLDVWRRSVDWTNILFDVANAFPQNYQFSLGEQLRRAALSIPTNIAEGCGRDRSKEQSYFFRIAKGSVYEVVSLLIIAGKQGVLSRQQYKEHYTEANEIAAMLTAFIKK